jgi:hypothetical protein
MKKNGIERRYIMTHFQGFENKKDAQEFVKNHGGKLTTRELTPKGRKSMTYNDYMQAVYCGGLDKEKYPYCVLWNEVNE